MINITASVKEAIEKMKRIPRRLEETTLPILRDSSDLIRRIMARPGLQVRYPIRWDSPKQRRYVIAKLRREGNLPHQRTGAHANAWETQDLANGSVVQNIGHKAVFLYGSASGEFAGARLVTKTGQSHIHEGRWRLVRPVIDSVMSRIPKQILERFKIEVNA
jgi:hypothetical protein